MLKNIPAILSPELVYNMMKMGHGDELILADGDFPVETYSQRVVYAYGHEISDMLGAILQFFPLDPFVEKPVSIMVISITGFPQKPCFKERGVGTQITHLKM